MLLRDNGDDTRVAYERAPNHRVTHNVYRASSTSQDTRCLAKCMTHVPHVPSQETMIAARERWPELKLLDE